MTKLSKAEKKPLAKQWMEAQVPAYILSKNQAEDLLGYLEEQLDITPCDTTMYFTMKWLEDHLPQEQIQSLLSEIREMGGYCDCEVLLNCYESYDID